MISQEIRRAFLEFFIQHGHTEVASSALIPANDPSLLFTNAGMVQFKDVFLGKEKRSYSCATTVQKCLRAGGKHNDLDNVGYTARHHTFFEMLGNFSFGQYFKEEAIHFAWNLLTKGFSLPTERLWVTIYDKDDQSYEIWSRIVKTERIIRIGDNRGAPFASDNFWQMADVGPCGPCTEIFYDQGSDLWGGLPGTPEEDGDRYMEIWNVVFMQYFRNESGVFEALPSPCVDTGMGLERIASVLQFQRSNYHTDLFVPLIQEAARLLEVETLELPSLKVLADHVRASTFMIADGIAPSNEGRGYVLRRIIRRALRHAHQLQPGASVLPELVPLVSQLMSIAYPELRDRETFIAQTLRTEEQKFLHTIDHGMHVLSQALSETSGFLSGEVVFKLYDTFGFPVDLTEDICRERGVSVDISGFERCMSEQKLRARTAKAFHHQSNDLNTLAEATVFLGYDQTTCPVEVVAILSMDKQTQPLIESGMHAFLVLDQTVFYAESGGQAGDTGMIRLSGAEVSVCNTIKIGKVFLHEVHVLEGEISLHDKGEACIDVDRRWAISRHHSATHLLHKALKDILGIHVEQKGSHVNEYRLRFDFAHHAPIDAELLLTIEAQVNREVLANTLVDTAHMSYQEAIQAGACFLKTEKYEEYVRVLKIGSSCELCGGAHVRRTGDIGCVKVIEQSAVGSGIRRIEAVAGLAFTDYVYGLDNCLGQIAGLCGVSPTQLIPRVISLVEESHALKKAVQVLRQDKMRYLLKESKQGARIINHGNQHFFYLCLIMPTMTLEEVDVLVDCAQKEERDLCFCVLTSIDDKRIVRILSTTSLVSAITVFKLLQQQFPDMKGGGNARRVKAQASSSLDMLEKALMSMITSL